MLQDRRSFLKATLAGTAALTIAKAQSAAVKATPIAENLYLLEGAGANVVAFTGPDGVTLVDGGTAERSADLLKAVAGLPGGKPVKTLFNTHWHPQQTGSNETLGKAGTTILAQENTRLWLQQNINWPYEGEQLKFKKLPKVAQPNKTFYDKGALDNGVRYGYISDAAHTDGDLYVYFPTQNVMAVGDAAYGQGWPVVDWWTGGWIGGIVGGLQRIQTVANRDTKIIPAVGPALTYADITTQIDMYGTIYDRLNQMINKGKGPREGVEAKPAKEYEAKMGNPDKFIQRSFESLWAYLSPDA